MLTPYDWQEGISHRASYIESRLEHGSPIIALSLDSGILLATFKRRVNKIYEVYDRLVMASIGQQSDVEALRIGSIDFAHQEGFNRSEQDVTIARVVGALSGSLKRAFSDFQVSPVVARTLFVEVNDEIAKDRYYILDYDGDYSIHHDAVVVAGDLELAESLLEAVRGIAPKSSQKEALKKVRALLQEVVDKLEFEDEFSFEAVLLERAEGKENRFSVVERTD